MSKGRSTIVIPKCITRLVLTWYPVGKLYFIFSSEDLTFSFLLPLLMKEILFIFKLFGCPLEVFKRRALIPLATAISLRSSLVQIGILMDLTSVVCLRVN
jgi:hypothetical protein